MIITIHYIYITIHHYYLCHYDYYCYDNPLLSSLMQQHVGPSAAVAYGACSVALHQGNLQGGPGGLERSHENLKPLLI